MLLVARQVLPRPPSEAFYAFNDVPDSDEEIEVGGQGGSDASGALRQVMLGMQQHCHDFSKDVAKSG